MAPGLRKALSAVLIAEELSFMENKKRCLYVILARLFTEDGAHAYAAGSGLPSHESRVSR